MIHHETVSFERVFSAAPARVFAAYKDIGQREKWSAPEAGMEVNILDCDFRVGGLEHAQCGPQGNMEYALSLQYHAIEEDELIVFSEELRAGDMMLTVALITFQLSETEQGGTTLKLTDQVTSFVGTEGTDGHQQGFTQALDNLVKALE